MLQENISVELLDVLLYREKKKRVHTAARPFSALSFRFLGESTFHLESGALTAGEGSIAFVPQGVDYDRTVRGEETIAVFHFLLHDASAGSIGVFLPADPAPYRVLFLEVLKIWEEKPKGYRYAAASVFYRILALMASDGALSLEQPHGIAERAAEYLGRHFRDRTLSVAVLAERCYVSEAYLRREFRARYGMSPKKYLDALRISHAESLLKTGYYSQKEIADRCGYSDVKYFRTAFKAKTGHTPMEYAEGCEKL